MAFQDDYHEVIDMAESLLVFIIRQLQERREYQRLTNVAKLLYPSAGTFRLGLDAQGKVPRITFMEAKKLLKEELGTNVDEQADFS